MKAWDLRSACLLAFWQVRREIWQQRHGWTAEARARLADWPWETYG